MSLLKFDGFRTVLEKAVAGDQTALEGIFRIYDPMIRRYSVLNGREDEDLWQYIMIRVALNISKFHI